LHINIKTFIHKQAINHKQAIIGGGYLFTENACYNTTDTGDRCYIYFDQIWI